MSYNIKKDLIVHITSSNPDDLKTSLHTLGLFNTHYDGWEATMQAGVKISTRYYYYSIPHTDVLSMLRHLKQVGSDYSYKIKINPEGRGNHDFD